MFLIVNKYMCGDFYTLISHIIKSPIMDRLKELIAETRAHSYSVEKPFKLASGRYSDHYFDLRKLCGHPEGINLVAETFLSMIGKDIKSVGGLESGSISISAAISQLSFLKSDHKLGSFYVRKKTKNHGAKKIIEGIPESPAVIVDDVITTGNSAIYALNMAGVECKEILCIVFRGTEKDKRKIERVAKFKYLLTEEDFH